MLVTKELLEQGRSVAEIAETRSLNTETVLNHVERLVRDGATFDLTPSLPAPERAEGIREALEAAGPGALRPVRERLGPAYSYDEIRTVRAHLRLRQSAPPLSDAASEP